MRLSFFRNGDLRKFKWKTLVCNVILIWRDGLLTVWGGMSISVSERLRSTLLSGWLTVRCGLERILKKAKAANIVGKLLRLLICVPGKTRLLFWYRQLRILLLARILRISYGGACLSPVGGCCSSESTWQWGTLLKVRAASINNPKSIRRMHRRWVGPCFKQRHQECGMFEASRNRTSSSIVKIDIRLFFLILREFPQRLHLCRMKLKPTFCGLKTNRLAHTFAKSKFSRKSLCMLFARSRKVEPFFRNGFKA